MACPITWCAFSWEAFATLFTGVSAVAGAVWVARGQTKIQKRQTEMQASALRSDLFDRRFENYESIRDFLSTFLRAPEEINFRNNEKFFIAKREARFLFSKKVWKGLEEIWLECIDLSSIASETNQSLVQEGYCNQELIERKVVLFNQVNAKYRTLHELYEEMNLGFIGIDQPTRNGEGNRP